MYIALRYIIPSALNKQGLLGNKKCFKLRKLLRAAAGVNLPSSCTSLSLIYNIVSSSINSYTFIVINCPYVRNILLFIKLYAAVLLDLFCFG